MQISLTWIILARHSLDKSKRPYFPFLLVRRPQGGSLDFELASGGLDFGLASGSRVRQSFEQLSPSLSLNFVTLLLLFLFRILLMVFFGLTGMIPPDRTMFKTPQVGRDTNSGQQLSSMEKLIRYAEKDDWLLYVTALFGILMPGIMYFFYKKAHNAYLDYAKTRAVRFHFLLGLTVVL